MWTYEVSEGEALVEGDNVVESLDLLGGKRDFECLKVLVEVLDLAAADDGEDMCRLLHHVGNRNCGRMARCQRRSLGSLSCRGVY